jgi:hypothetical protein
LKRVSIGCLLACLSLAHPSASAAEAKIEGPWSFFGGFTWHELSDPGLHLGAEYALAATQHFQTLVAFSFQAYHQPDTESGYAVQVRWGQRYTAGFGLTFEDYLGIGVQYTRWDTTVFEFKDSIGRAVPQTRSGMTFAPHIVFGPGYDFDRLLGVPLQVAARPGVTLLYPDMNGTFQVSAMIEFSLRWTPAL